MHECEWKRSASGRERQLHSRLWCIFTSSLCFVCIRPVLRTFLAGVERLLGHYSCTRYRIGASIKTLLRVSLAPKGCVKSSLQASAEILFSSSR